MSNSKERKLFRNTAMLYILTFSNYLFNFITVPYQTRILGPEIYGSLGFAQSFVTYFQLVLDFGFLLSATAQVAKAREDRQALSRIMTAVFCSKLILGAVCMAVITTLCFGVERFRADALLYLLFFGSSLVNALLPDYLYRGLEDMSAITYRSLATKAFFTVMIFLTLKTKEQYYLVPILNILGGMGAFAWVYYDCCRRLQVRFVHVSAGEVLSTLRSSCGYFFSRIASTVYGATNTFILGFLYPAGSTLGYYTSAEKLMSTARSALSPISDSLYPYMVKNRDFRLAKKVMLVLMPIIILGCTVLGIFAEPFCVLFFGEEYSGTGEVLRYMLPIVVITLPSYLCGFPMLTPLGMQRYANSSVIIGAVVQAMQLLALYLIGILEIRTICIATCVTELVVLAVRVGAIAYAMRRNEKE